MTPLANLPQGRSNPDVLLIDDSVTDLRLLMNLMTSQKLRVSVAFDGERGYQQAVLQQPGLILLDVRMPVMDGFATCRRLKANPQTQQIPVLFLTAASDLPERLEGFALGAVDYIGKPFDALEVLARVGVHMPHPAPAALDPAQPLGHGLDAVLVVAAKKVLAESLASPPTLERLAQLLGTNRRRLNEAFQSNCGLPVFGWLREERLRQGHLLVSQTDTPINQIGSHLGYATSANFAKAFKERFGCPPRTMRAEMSLARQGLAPRES